MALILHTKSTKALRNTIRSLRKEYNIRGDELSKELGRGAAYISQVESGKIKHIELNNIRNIFYIISTVCGNGIVTHPFIVNYSQNSESYSLSRSIVSLMARLIKALTLSP